MYLRRNMLILEIPRWRTARMFQPQYLKNHATMKKQQKPLLVISKALSNEQRIVLTLRQI